MKYSKIKFITKALAVFIFLMFTASISNAQNLVSKTAEAHIKNIERVCIDNWESQTCLVTLSQSSLALTSNYGATLQNKGAGKHTETLKQGCAASTAALNGRYPANALTSAFTECANTIYDLTEKTNIFPDPTHFSLLVGSVLCLQKNPTCEGFQKKLANF
jgi:hypothetical protein